MPVQRVTTARHRVAVDSPAAPSGCSPCNSARRTAQGGGSAIVACWRLTRWRLLGGRRVRAVSVALGHAIARARPAASARRQSAIIRLHRRATALGQPFAGDGGEFGLQPFQPALDILESGRGRACARWPLTRRRCRAGSRICRATGAPGMYRAERRTAASSASSVMRHAVMLLQHRHQPAHHRHRNGMLRLVHLSPSGNGV